MTATDPFEYDDAAYLLGALTGDDRRAFETHLHSCAACRARVDDLRSTADLLAGLPRMLEEQSLVEAAGPGPGPVPDTLLPSLLRRAARERRRRRLFTGAIVAVAAACLVALAIVIWPGPSSSPAHRPPAQALSAVHPNPLQVTARLTTKAWGTEIELHCTYPSNEHERFAYGLVVFDGRGRPHRAGDWTLVPGKEGIRFTTGTSVPAGQIKRLQVQTSSGLPLLELKL